MLNLFVDYMFIVLCKVIYMEYFCYRIMVKMVELDNFKIFLFRCLLWVVVYYRDIEF